MANFRQRLLGGEKVKGIMLRIVRNPAACYLVGNSGLDFVMYDCEHSNYSMETLHDMFLTGNALGYASLVRVPAGTKEWISRVLDSGATGVMVPMIESKEQAEALAYYAKYTPIGNRGYGSGLAHCDYKSGKHVEVMKEQNEKTLTICQIETVGALENIDAIASVDGIDAMLIGPNDLSISLGIPGDLMNPIEIDAIKKVVAACKKHGKAFGMHASVQMQTMFKDDITLMMLGLDTDLLTNGFKATKANLEAIYE